MKLSDGITTALTALRVHKLRTVLSASAVGAGVAAVIAMIAIGSGAQDRVLSQIKRMGTNTFVLWPGWVVRAGVNLGGHAATSLTDDDATGIERLVEGVEATAPIMFGETRVIYGSFNWKTMLTGTDLGYFKIREWDTARGRLFDDIEMLRGSQVAIIGSTLAQKIFQNDDPIGKTVRIGRALFRVVGVMAVVANPFPVETRTIPFSFP